jgi:hypothetical protein
MLCLVSVSAFPETGSFLKGHSPGRPSISQDDIEHIRVTFHYSQKHSVRHVSRQLRIPKSTVYDAHGRLKLRASKLQFVQHIQPRDKSQRVNIVTFMPKQLTAVTITSGKFFSPTRSLYIHTIGVLNSHNCRIWGSENPWSNGAYSRQHVGPNCWTLLPRGRRHECTLPGYAR